MARTGGRGVAAPADGGWGSASLELHGFPRIIPRFAAAEVDCPDVRADLRYKAYNAYNAYNAYKAYKAYKAHKTHEAYNAHKAYNARKARKARTAGQGRKYRAKRCTSPCRRKLGRAGRLVVRFGCHAAEPRAGGGAAGQRAHGFALVGGHGASRFGGGGCRGRLAGHRKE